MHVGRRPNISTASCCSLEVEERKTTVIETGSLVGESTEGSPMEARGSSTSTMQNPQPLWGKGFIVGGTTTSILRGGTANGKDLSVHQGFLNQTPRITATHANGGIKQKWRHDQCRNSLKDRRRWGISKLRVQEKKRFRKGGQKFWSDSCYESNVHYI